MKKLLRKLVCNKYWVFINGGMISKYTLFITTKNTCYILCLWLDQSRGFKINKHIRNGWAQEEIGPGHFWTVNFGKLFMLGKSVREK